MSWQLKSFIRPSETRKLVAGISNSRWRSSVWHHILCDLCLWWTTILGRTKGGRAKGLEPNDGRAHKGNNLRKNLLISVCIFYIVIYTIPNLNRTIHSQTLKSIRPQRPAMAPLVMYPIIPLPMRLAPLLRNLYNRKQPIATCMVRLKIDPTKVFQNWENQRNQKNLHTTIVKHKYIFKLL